MSVDGVITEAEDQEMNQRALKEEIEAFTRVGHKVFTQDDIIFAAYLNREITMTQATLNLIRRGELAVELAEPIEESKLYATKRQQ